MNQNKNLHERVERESLAGLDSLGTFGVTTDLYSVAAV
jgi:hypothetical protein